MYVFTCLTSSARGHRHTHMCESYATSNPGSLSFFLSGRREKDTDCGWSRGSQNLGAPLPPKNAVRAARQEVLSDRNYVSMVLTYQRTCEEKQ